MMTDNSNVILLRLDFPIETWLSDEEKKVVTNYREFIIHTTLSFLNSAFQNPERKSKKPGNLDIRERRAMDRIVDVFESMDENWVIALSPQLYTKLKELWKDILLPPMGGAIQKLWRALDKVICPEEQTLADAEFGITK